MRRSAIALAVAATVLAGCGEGRAPARGAGSHCQDVTDVHPMTTFPELVAAPRWAVVADLEVTGGDPDVVTARLSVREPLRGEWTDTEQARVTAEGADEARAERDAGARLLAFGERGEVLGLAALRPNGEARFLGHCTDRVYRPALQRFRDLRASGGDDRTEAELLVELARHPDGEAAVALRELARPRATPVPTPWGSLPPDKRSLDAAPPSVLDALERRTLAVSLPASWQRAEVEICPRIALGWNACLVPQAARGTIDLPVYVEPGAPLEVWVAEIVRGVSGRRVLALTIPAEALGAERIEVVGGEGIDSAEEVYAAAEAGTALRLRG